MDKENRKITIEEYQKIIASLFITDAEYFSKSHILSISIEKSKIVSHNFGDFFEGFHDFKSLLINLYSVIWFLQGYLFRIKYNGIQPQKLDSNKIYNLKLKIDSNGVDIVSKQGFGFSVFTKFEVLLESLQMTLNEFIEFIKTNKHINNFNFHKKYVDALQYSFMHIERGLDAARIELFSSLKEYFIDN